MLIGAYGTQNTPLRSPSIAGLENFKGPVVHTGNWDDDLQWHGKRIAVIGNGSSGIQTVAAMQPHADKITHYIRSPTWISLNYMSQFTRNGNGRNFECERWRLLDYTNGSLKLASRYARRERSIQRPTKDLRISSHDREVQQSHLQKSSLR